MGVLLSKKIIIRTDLQSLKYLIEQRLTIPTQQVWLAKLLQFDFEIRYKKGKENTVADALSKCASGELYALSTLMLTSELLDLIKQIWITDSSLQRLIIELQVNPTSHTSYTYYFGQLRRKQKINGGS